MIMLEIDGSQGEGGGQVLRTSLSLSALTGRPFRLTNIRDKRSKPGLRPQHVTAVRAVASICDAEVTEDEINSTTLTFAPQSKPKGGDYTFDVTEAAQGRSAGAATLKDAMNEALRDWVANVHDTFYIIGTAAGPHPYPELVRDFQSVIGREARAQLLDRTGRLPDMLVAAIGGGSNAIGLFHPFLDDESVEMLGIEAAGHGLDKEHAASLAGGRPGILHGNKTYLLQDEDGELTAWQGSEFVPVKSLYNNNGPPTPCYLASDSTGTLFLRTPATISSDTTWSTRGSSEPCSTIKGLVTLSVWNRGEIRFKRTESAVNGSPNSKYNDSRNDSQYGGILFRVRIQLVTPNRFTPTSNSSGV